MAKELSAARKIREELEGLEKEYRFELPRLIREAAAQGDLSDNAEYRAAKQRQEFVQARIVHLKERLASLSMINMASIPRDRVGFGSVVALEDLDSGEERVFRIVLPEEVDAAAGKISVRSPVGQQLIGKQEGDEIVITTPKGTASYVVNTLETLHDLSE
jgi:transcription elongation factor GreA